MSETSRNWDFSRLAYMDVVIMQIAIAEMLTFPNIPVSVTINEYVELAKLYSTPKSGSYIMSTGKLLKTIEDRPQRRQAPRRPATSRLNRAQQALEDGEVLRTRYAEQAAQEQQEEKTTDAE